MLPFKGIMLRKGFDCPLKQAELVWNEWVLIYKLIFIIEIPVSLGTVTEIKQGLEVIILLLINIQEDICCLIILEEEPLFNDLVNILT